MNKLIEMDKAFNDLKNSYRHLRNNLLLSEYQASSRYCYIISAGHGGIDSITGQYTTAPAKQHQHEKGEFHGDRFFYEGVFNRVIADKLCKKLKEAKMVYKKLYHDTQDWSLKYKKDQANNHHTNAQKSILIDLHSNAFDGSARGFSVYTSKGQTAADPIASKLWQLVRPLGKKYNFPMRSQTWKDNDYDFESRLYMLDQTICPSILPECLFFDNFEDASILMLESFQDDYVSALFELIKWCEKSIKV
jgi:N-acetylmuramoyl-L-alanine amidase